VIRPQLPSRFDVRGLLGEGGSGRVFRVRDATRDVDLALKLVTANESAFLRREFDTLRQIRHENLIQVFDWGTLPSGEAYYTMELIEGEDWGRRMGSPQSYDEVKRILTGLARGLAHLHCHREIHGDLKPGNILLGKGDVVKVTDVGMGGRGETTEGMSGTPGYAAPECWEGAQPDVRSDLYSIGVMAYEALAGKHPFEGKTIREVVAGQLKGWAPSPGAHGIRVPADLERAVMRAMERDPELRQGSGDEFLEGMGVKDRVGAVVPGGFVDRDQELEQLSSLFPQSLAGSPTLCVVVGDEGIGRGSLIREFVRRGAGIDFDTYELPLQTWGEQRETLSWLLAAVKSSETEHGEPSIGSVSKHLKQSAERRPILLWSDIPYERFPTQYATCSTLARFTWAESVEDAAPSNLMFLFPTSGESIKPELYQKQVALGSLSAAAIDSLIRSLLGRTSLPSEFVGRVANESNGSPELVIAIIQEAIEQGILARRGGEWQATQTGSIEAMRFASASSHYLSMYQALPRAARLISAMLALLPGKLTEAHLEKAMANGSDSHAIATLMARGWIISRGSHLRLASESIGQAILDGAPEEELRLAAESLIGAEVEGLTEVEMADVLLRSDPSSSALVASLTAARRLINRGDVSQAVPRLKHVVNLAKHLTLVGIEAEALLLLADAEHRLGHHEAALSILNARIAPSSSDAQRADIEASRLEASVVAALGDYDRARDCLMLLIDESTSSGGIRTALDSHAQLAELDWTRGNEAQRSSAIERIRLVLDQISTEEDVAEQRAALTYGLGSALIRAGRREEASGVLEREYANAPTDYWKMRIANAMASASYYLTNLDAGLSWADRALAHAERASADSLRVRILSNRAIMLFGLGRIREAAEEHMKTASLARRVGNQFEYASACVSTGADLVWLARYEEGIRYAEEGLTTASIMNDLRYRGKSLEVKAWGLFLSGDFEEAMNVTEQAGQVMDGFEYIDCKPRIDWHRARIHVAKGELEEAEGILVKVERGLLVTRDLEDLWGVQIELNRIRHKMEPSIKHLDVIGEIAAESDRAGVVVVYLAAAIALAEGFIQSKRVPDVVLEVLKEALRRSERAGTDEMTWQLQMNLGKLAGDLRDQRAAKGYFTSALRTIRLIADRLSPRMRHHYLTSPTVMNGLNAMSQS